MRGKESRSPPTREGFKAVILRSTLAKYHLVSFSLSLSSQARQERILIVWLLKRSRSLLIFSVCGGFSAPCLSCICALR